MFTLLRGLSVVPEALLLMRGSTPFPPRVVVCSRVSIAIGLCDALGTRQAWRRLRHYDPPW